MQKEERVEKLVNEITELKLSKRVAKLLYMQNDFLLVGTSMGLVTGLYFGKIRSTVCMFMVVVCISMNEFP
jgi:hypothetical protein